MGDASGGIGPVDGADRRGIARALTLEALSRLPSGTITVSGETQSMQPLLRGGETLHWSRPAGPPRFGDLLLFLEAPGPVVHRVVWRGRGGTVRTKGDARAGLDAWRVRAADALGVVSAIETSRGRLDLSRPGARAHARAAALCSLAGAGAWAGASLADAVLRRLLPGRRDPRVFRRPAWWTQGAAQRILYRLFW